MIGTLHDVLVILKSDAGQLEELGLIELSEDWEQEVSRLAHRYEKEILRVYNSFSNPETSDEHDWIEAHMHATQEFLIRHGLAVNKDNEDDIQGVPCGTEEKEEER